MRLTVHHGSIGALGFLMQPQLFGPVLVDLLGLASSPRVRCAVAILRAVRGERTGVGEDAARVGRMLTDDVAGHAMTTVVALDGLMMLVMGLLVLVALLRVVVYHRQALPGRRAIETVAVPLLMVLAVHAS